MKERENSIFFFFTKTEKPIQTFSVYDWLTIKLLFDYELIFKNTLKLYLTPLCEFEGWKNSYDCILEIYHDDDI